METFTAIVVVGVVEVICVNILLDREFQHQRQLDLIDAMSQLEKSKLVETYTVAWVTYPGERKSSIEFPKWVLEAYRWHYQHQPVPPSTPSPEVQHAVDQPNPEIGTGDSDGVGRHPSDAVGGAGQQGRGDTTSDTGDGDQRIADSAYGSSENPGSESSAREEPTDQRRG